jgi:hypothetical protein
MWCRRDRVFPTLKLSYAPGIKHNNAMSCDSRAPGTSNLYHYAPLEKPTHIRVLHLKRGKDGDPLQGTIEHVDVNSDVMFSAISYVWGDEETPYRILLACNQYLPLTRSLHEALQNLRAVEDIGQTTFWADQICIDQVNTDERNHQVAVMGSIYRKATQVITYIGPDTPQDHKGIDLVRTCNRLWQEIRNSSQRLDYVEARSFLKKHLPGQDDPAWEGYSSITNRAWSTRLWMIQENVVNDNTIMVCGTTAFQWTVPGVEVLDATFDNFPERIRFVIYNRGNRGECNHGCPSSSPLPSVGQLLGLRAMLSEKGCNSLPLLDLLRTSRDFACQDLRDKVYALLGLASDLDILAIKPDYTKSPAQVLTDTALRILRSSSNLDLLNHVGNTKELKIPSWTPDWSPPRSRFLLKPLFLSKPGWKHCASADTSQICYFDADQLVLTVRGAILDSIRCSAGDPTINASLLAREPDLILEEYPRMMKVLDKTCSDFIYHLGSDNVPAKLMDDLSRTIIADRLHHGEGGSTEPSACFSAYLEVCRVKYEMSLFKRNGESLPWMQRDVTTEGEGSKYSNSSIVAEGRSLCVTKKGRLCLAPSETKVGDKVAILYGGKTAYILRPAEDDFELLGEAYVHGLMKGEALEDPIFHSNVRKIRLI